MQAIILKAEPVSFKDKQDPTKQIAMTKLTILQKNLRIKESYITENNQRGFDKKSVVDLFSMLEDDDYVDVTFEEDFKGKLKLDNIQPYVAE